MENKVKLDTGVVIIKTQNDNYYQVSLTESEFESVISLIIEMHGGVLRILEGEINYLTF